MNATRGVYIRQKEGPGQRLVHVSLTMNTDTKMIIYFLHATP